jgi:hypothetical protein
MIVVYVAKRLFDGTFISEQNDARTECSVPDGLPAARAASRSFKYVPKALSVPTKSMPIITCTAHVTARHEMLLVVAGSGGFAHWACDCEISIYEYRWLALLAPKMQFVGGRACVVHVGLPYAEVKMSGDG